MELSRLLNSVSNTISLNRAMYVLIQSKSCTELRKLLNLHLDEVLPYLPSSKFSLLNNVTWKWNLSTMIRGFVLRLCIEERFNGKTETYSCFSQNYALANSKLPYYNLHPTHSRGKCNVLLTPVLSLKLCLEVYSGDLFLHALTSFGV